MHRNNEWAIILYNRCWTIVSLSPKYNVFSKYFMYFCFLNQQLHSPCYICWSCSIFMLLISQKSICTWSFSSSSYLNQGIKQWDVPYIDLFYKNAFLLNCTTKEIIHIMMNNTWCVHCKISSISPLNIPGIVVTVTQDTGGCTTHPLRSWGKIISVGGLIELLLTSV